MKRSKRCYSYCMKIKKPVFHPTPKQQSLADEILRNQMRPPKERLNKKELANYVGFKSSQALRSTGVKFALERYGLTEKLINAALVEDIKAKPADRVAELRLGADILGLTKRHGDDGGGNKTLVLVLPPEIMKKHQLPVTDIANSDIVIRDGGHQV